MQRTTVQVSDEVAQKLAAEASLRQLTVEELATERISAPSSRQKSQSHRNPKKGLPNYLELAGVASKAPSARKSLNQIDADIEASRDEW